MARVLDTGETCETNYIAQPARTLMNRSREPGPFDGDFQADVALTSCVGESGETSQTLAFGLERKSARTAHRQIRLHGVTNMVAPPATAE